VLRIEDKLHYADFGRLQHVTSDSGRLTGPINIIQIGLALAL
jgi:hypothetical protein